MQNSLKKIFSSLLILSLFQGLVFPGVLDVQNTFIKISVDDASARFSLETKQGDPNEPDDDNKPLLNQISLPSPPSSLTTIYIEDEPYIFGSSQGYYISRPEVKGDKIVTEWSVKGIVIKQEVSLVDNPSTGRQDAMRVLYKIKNENRRKTSVGLRLLLDTVIGDFKSTPFSVPGIGEIANETQFYRKNLPQYWYSFDDNSNPVTRTQGILKGSGITTPDKVVFANWSRLFDNLWDISVDATKDMRKSGTARFDGSVAQYYGPLDLEQNEMILITAYYGIYGVSFFTSEDLSLSLSVPAESKTMPVPVNVEVKNKGKYALDKLKIELVVPEGFTLAPNETPSVEFVKMEANSTRQGQWNLMTTKYTGDITVQVKARGWLEDNEQSVLASKIFKVDYSQNLVVKEDAALKEIENTAIVNLTNTNKLLPVVTNTLTNLVVEKTVKPTNNVVMVKTNVVEKVVVEEAKKQYVMSKEERDILNEIEALDKLVDDVDKKYQILLEVYRNSFVTNQALDSIKIDIQNYQNILLEEEAALSNQMTLYKE